MIESPTEINKIALCKAKVESNEKIAIEDLYWRQKTNIKWSKEGDLNTRYFHQAVKQKRQKLYLHQIKGEDGNTISANDEIKSEAIKYFQKQLNRDHVTQGDDLLLNIPMLLSDEDSVFLGQFLTIEVQQVVEGMDNKA